MKKKKLKKKKKSWIITTITLALPLMIALAATSSARAIHYNTPPEIQARSTDLAAGTLPQMQSGDTIWAYAEAIGTTTEEIAEWMGIPLNGVERSLPVGTVVARNADEATVAQKINHGEMSLTEAENAGIVIGHSITEADLIEESKKATEGVTSPTEAITKAVGASSAAGVEDYEKVFNTPAKKTVAKIVDQVTPILKNVDDKLKKAEVAADQRVQVATELAPRLVAADLNQPTITDAEEEISDRVLSGIVEDKKSPSEMAEILENIDSLQKAAITNPQTEQPIEATITPENVATVAQTTTDPLITDQEDSTEAKQQVTKSEQQIAEQPVKFDQPKNEIVQKVVDDAQTAAKNDVDSKPIDPPEPIDPPQEETDPWAKLLQANNTKLTVDEQTFVKDLFSKVATEVDTEIRKNRFYQEKLFELSDLERFFEIFARVNAETPLAIEHQLANDEEGYLVTGDTHGFPTPSLELIKQAVDENKVIVLTGDYWDRGENSIENAILLYTYKMLRPDKIILIKGNHDTMADADKSGTSLEFIRKYSKKDDNYNNFIDAVSKEHVVYDNLMSLNSEYIKNYLPEVRNTIQKIALANATLPIVALLHSNDGKITDYGSHGGIPVVDFQTFAEQHQYDNYTANTNPTSAEFYAETKIPDDFDVLAILKELKGTPEDLNTITSQMSLPIEAIRQLQILSTMLTKVPKELLKELTTDQVAKIIYDNIYKIMYNDVWPMYDIKVKDQILDFSNYSRGAYGMTAFQKFYEKEKIQDALRGHQHEKQMVTNEIDGHRPITMMGIPQIGNGEIKVADLNVVNIIENLGAVVSLDKSTLEPTVVREITDSKEGGMFKIEKISMTVEDFAKKQQNDHLSGKIKTMIKK